MGHTQSKLNRVFTDTSQTAWQLATIQLTGISSLPILISSLLLIRETNFLSAVLTLLIANIITFFVRVAVVTMSFKGRKSTLEVGNDYLGYYGRYFVAIMLLMALLAWYFAETTLASHGLFRLFQFNETSDIDHWLQINVLIGVLSTFLCMEGIRSVRRFTSIAFPIILACYLVIFFIAEKPLSLKGPIEISLKNLTLVLVFSLGYAADLPTFFRHSRSERDSFLALIIFQIFAFGFSVAGLFLGSVFDEQNGINPANNLVIDNMILRIALIINIIFSVLCANIVIIYASSVGWEVIVPILAGRKEYAILGLSCTIIYVLIGDIFSMLTLLHIVDTTIINLSYVFIIGFIVYLIQKKRPTVFQQTVYLIAWVVASLVNNIPKLQPMPLFHYEPITGFVVIVAIVLIGQLLHSIIPPPKQRVS